MISDIKYSVKVTKSQIINYRLYDSYANELLPLNVDDGSGKYVPVISATLNHLKNSVSISIIGMNKYNPVYTRSADRYYANKILTDNKTSLMNTINGVIRNHAQTYWKNH